MTDSTIILYKGSLTKPGNNVQAVKTKDAEKPTGEWNKSEIIVEKGRITFIVNDKKVVDALLWDKDWNAMIAGSKFAGYKNFAKTSKGSLALQDHGGEVWFKNIMIKNL